MKKNDLAEIKGLEVAGLLGRVKKLKQEIADSVIDKNMNKLKDTRTISKKRRDVAQLLTIVRQKQLLEQFNKAAVTTVEAVATEMKEPKVKTKKGAK